MKSKIKLFGIVAVALLILVAISPAVTIGKNIFKTSELITNLDEEILNNYVNPYIGENIDYECPCNQEQDLTSHPQMGSNSLPNNEENGIELQSPVEIFFEKAFGATKKTGSGMIFESTDDSNTYGVYYFDKTTTHFPRSYQGIFEEHFRYRISEMEPTQEELDEANLDSYESYVVAGYFRSRKNNYQAYINGIIIESSISQENLDNVLPIAIAETESQEYFLNDPSLMAILEFEVAKLADKLSITFLPKEIYEVTDPLFISHGENLDLVISSAYNLSILIRDALNEPSRDSGKSRDPFPCSAEQAAYTDNSDSCCLCYYERALYACKQSKCISLAWENFQTQLESAALLIADIIAVIVLALIIYIIINIISIFLAGVPYLLIAAYLPAAWKIISGGIILGIITNVLMAANAYEIQKQNCISRWTTNCEIPNNCPDCPHHMPDPEKK